MGQAATLQIHIYLRHLRSSAVNSDRFLREVQAGEFFIVLHRGGIVCLCGVDFVGEISEVYSPAVTDNCGTPQTFDGGEINALIAGARISRLAGGWSVRRRARFCPLSGRDAICICSGADSPADRLWRSGPGSAGFCGRRSRSADAARAAPE